MKYVKLGDVCEFINGDRGKNYPSSKDFVDKGIPFINAGHIQNNDISFENMNYISKEKFNKLGSGKVKKNDILYCLRGSLGKNAIVNIEEGAIASSLVILRSKTEDIDVNYLIKYLNSNYIKEQILKYNNGSSQPNLSAASVKNFNIYLPNYEKQKEISRILDKAQQLIDKRKEQIEALDELVKSKFIEMFGNYFKNKEHFYSLMETCNFIDYRGKTPEKSESGITLITAKNVKSHIFSFEPREYIPEENYEEIMTRGIPMVNDILFTTEAPLGNVCRIPKIEGKFCVGQRLITMQPKENIVSEYLEYALLSEEFQREMWKVSSGSTVKGIRSKELVKLKVPVPPIELQNKFADFVKYTDKLKFEMEKSLKELEDNFNSLMQKAFKGELFD